MKAHWKNAGYGFETLSLAGGLIAISVGWDSTSPKRTPSGYRYTIQGYRSTRLYDSMQDCKSDAIERVRKLLSRGLADLSELLMGEAAG